MTAGNVVNNIAVGGGGGGGAGPIGSMGGVGGGAGSGMGVAVAGGVLDEATNSSRPYDTPERRSSIRIRGQNVNDSRNVK